MKESSRFVGPWRQAIGYKARAEYRRLPPHEGPIGLTLEFIMPARKREPAPPGPHTVVPDLDKLVRAVLDALTGIAYRDDSQVTHILASKRRATAEEKTGVLITAWPA